jgi:hypothetical protein
MKFEDAGRALDAEIAKLRGFLDERVHPRTRQEMIKFLRQASERLAKLADKLEKSETSN